MKFPDFLFLLFISTLYILPAAGAGELEKEITAIKESIEYDELETAAKSARKLVKANPRSAAAHAILGRVRMLSGDMKEAEVEVRRALRLNGRYPEAHWYMGMIYMETGRTKDAVTEYQTALKLKPKLAKEKGCGDCNWIKNLTK